MRIETFGKWTGTLHVEGEQQFTSDGTRNFTVNTKKSLPYVFAEVRQASEEFPFQLCIERGKEAPPPVREV